MSRPWIKQPTTKLNDARLSFVSIQAQRDYFMMYLLAGQIDADGLFVEHGRRLSDKEIAFRIHTKADRLVSSMKELKRENLLHINGRGPQIADWQHEQINWREKQDADRSRQARHRDVTRDGEPVTLLDQTRSRLDVDVDKKKIRPSPPTPRRKASSSAGKAGKGTRKASGYSSDTEQIKRKEIALTILRSSGLRNPKLKSISVLVATRHFKNNKTFVAYLLAALASAYADPSANDKPIIAAHRIEHDAVPPQFKQPDQWRSLPAEILQAAGVDTKARDKPSTWTLDKWDTSK